MHITRAYDHNGDCQSDTRRIGGGFRFEGGVKLWHFQSDLSPRAAIAELRKT